ncbi:unnamed protein product [Ranitomeya imitator]|uniref:Reelin domain-containing protein n=1 Tax=Ranitomeya imitator TaxID=111125 RepID=A0ABN9KYM7_9NEOB|nr:unnamed protein product [Ranitomeya imitator]
MDGNIVQLNGTGNFTVLFQAVIGSGSVGKWSAESENCDGSPLFINHSLSSQHIVTAWTSPVNVTSATIKVYLHNTAETFALHKILLKDSSPGTNTTKVTTTHRVVKTTSAASIDQSSLVSMALSLILGVLLIPNKYLS